MKARVKRLSGQVFKPVAVALDPRLEALEHRLRLRMDQLENHVATDAEVATEMTITQARALDRLEARLEAIEASLAALVERSGAPADSATPRRG